MTAQPAVDTTPSHRALPDYLPARMINEHVYCPRLFYFEQVEGVFADNEYTVEGSVQHKRVDKEGKSAPKPDEESDEPAVVRSITLSSEEHRVIAKLDLAEFDGGRATPVDYKRGSPDEVGRRRGRLAERPRADGRPGDLVLRANGYRSDEGVVFYQKTRQRVRVRFDEETMAWAESAIADAWKTAGASEIPPPLVDSPKCPGCSLVGICMPDETWNLRSQAGNGGPGQLKLFETGPGVPDISEERATRLLVAPRAELRPLYVNSPKLRVGKSGGVLRIKENDRVMQNARINEICQVNLMGAVQISTQAVQELCREEKPICYFSQGGWFYGVTTGLGTKNVLLRRAQFRLAEEEWFCLRLARRLVSGKIRNQRTMLLRNHVEPPKLDMREMKRLVGRAESAESLDELLGLEGWAARIYFGLFAGMVKREQDEDAEGNCRSTSRRGTGGRRGTR